MTPLADKLGAAVDAGYVEGGQIVVEKQPGATWLTFNAAEL